MSHQGQQGSLVSDGGFQMSGPPPGNEASVTTHSIQDDNPPPMEEFQEDFEVPREKSNQSDPERRAREFRARHIQMMALGIKPAPN
jgi:amino acid permease